MCDIVIGLATGLISGFVSGYIVYLITAKKERERQLYRYWTDFLFKAMEKNEVYIPSEQLRNALYIGPVGSRWYESINTILNIMNPYEIEDKEFSEEGTILADNMLIAYEELGKWAKGKRIR